jgi:hypothetical protein
VEGSALFYRNDQTKSPICPALLKNMQQSQARENQHAEDDGLQHIAADHKKDRGGNAGQQFQIG